MVKMVLGSSDSQATSVAALADNYTAAFESLISAFDNLANEDKLSGSAYTNIKSYGSSVVAPLVKAFILLADAAKADVQKLPDEYRAQVGGEDLDEETLTAQISAYATTIEANQTSATSLGKTEPMTDVVQASINSLNDAVASDTAAKAELEEKLRKLLEYNAQSSGFFSDIASLESAVTTGISQLQAGVTSFNGIFTLPSKKDLAWTKTVNSQWEEREAYLEAVDKVKKGKALKAKDVKAIERYQKKHPNVKLDKTVEEAQKVYRLKKNYKAVVAKVKDGKTLTAKDIKAIEAYQKAYPKAKLDADVLRLKKLADFKRKVDQMDPQTFKKTYKEVIRKYDSHDYMGLDANDLYVIERYKKIKNTPEYQAIPEPKVSKAFKKEVDGLSLKELKQAFPYLWHPVPGNQLSIEGYFQSETERQKELYVINRYYELLAKEPVSERSPTFMQDYVAYVNQTGLNPFTGKKASDDVMFMAKHYHTVQAVSAFGLTLTGGYMDYVGLKSGVSAAAVSDDVGEINSQLSSSKKMVSKASLTVSKYNDLYDYEFNGTTHPGPLAELPSTPNRNFYGGRYNSHVLTEDTIFYRAGSADNPMGQWFTIEAPTSRTQVRIDTAVKDIWTNPDGSYSGQSPIDKVYKIKMPKGTTIYDGPVGSQGGIYQGGLNKNQIFIDSPWNIDGVEVVDSWPIIQ
ncbi:T7SS effector LXG polymorphic toxin [Streptococcus ferus]|uniref:Membrane protein n=1 Tax=Streptococcus ferus TaxID=1345 RepID=A0A2X3Y098_9STRE|nr:T7SS effector LXG polymorphic toxin [Streptococcus ferus]SQF40781.1 membrane protein [Streptococcus ferus]